jgi:hypothetical protein
LKNFLVRLGLLKEWASDEDKKQPNAQKDDLTPLLTIFGTAMLVLALNRRSVWNFVLLEASAWRKDV